MNNIIIYSKTLNEHLQHLEEIFNSLSEKGICLFSRKSFLSYLTVQLLSQCVDTLELATAEDKLTVITNIEFP